MSFAVNCSALVFYTNECGSDPNHVTVQGERVCVYMCVLCVHVGVGVLCMCKCICVCKCVCLIVYEYMCVTSLD